MHIRDAVREVLNYLYEEEKKHYNESQEAEREGHIYPALDYLRRWLEEANSSSDTAGAPKG